MANPSRKPFKYWTPEEEDLLKDLWYNDELTREDLVKVFLRTWPGIERKAFRLELPPRHLIEQQRIDEKYLESLLKVVEG